MTMHPIQKKLLQAIALFEKQELESEEKALSILRGCSKFLSRDTLADIIYRSSIGWLKSSYEYSHPENLLRYRQELMGQSPRLFHAHLSKDYTAMMTDQEILLRNHLLAYIEYLETFHYADDAGALAQQKQEYTAYKQTLVELSAPFPPTEHEFDEKVYHFILRIAINTLQQIDPFMDVSKQDGFIVHFGHGMTLIGDVMINGQERYPTVTQDVAWAKNALWAIQGKTWICFTWQIFPENIMFIVK